VHLDHESCLEVSVLRGRTADVRHYADHVIAERGVRFGRLVLVPLESSSETHVHGPGGARHAHAHVKRK
jgi:CopG family nickel-responsive transcriptional regulator